MSHYPAVSHAFVLREVEALREQGVDVQTLSIHRVSQTELLAGADRAAGASTFNVLPTGIVRLLLSHSIALLRNPAAYLCTLALALRIGEAGLRQRLWHLFYFAEAMILLRHCRQANIAHIHAQFADSATDAAMLVTNYDRRARSAEEAMTWSLAVHGSVEFYDVNRYAIADKLQHANFAVAISDFGRSQLMRLSSQERWSHIHVVRCGVDLGVYVPPPARSETATRATVLCVGRLLHGKGLPLLFESIRLLRSQSLDVALVLVGDGPDRAELERFAGELGITNHVRFFGAVGQDDIRAFYESADIFCLPSFAEGIPVVAMEAMAMELPVVTTRIMGTPELIEDDADGRLVAPGRVDELTDALRALVIAPWERRRLGAAARCKISRDYDVRKSAFLMRSVFEKELNVDLGQWHVGAAAPQRVGAPNV